MDLFSYITKYGYFSEDNVKPIVKKLLNHIKIMHDNNIIHKDIKPENIIYNKNTGNVYIIDYEEGKYTEEYCSPEKLKHLPITTKHDMWSLGVTIYSITTGYFPFKGEKEILHGNLGYKKYWSSDFKDFLGNLLEKDIELRYSIDDILAHEWIQN